jgi:hypothetical protein
MPIDLTPQHGGGGCNNSVIPGIWHLVIEDSQERSQHVLEVDPRAILTAKDKEDADAIKGAHQPDRSTWRRAQRVTVSVERGEPQRLAINNAVRRLADDSVPWIADRYSGIRELIVWPDDHVEPAPRHPGADCCDGGPVLRHEEGCDEGPRGDSATG